MNEDLERQLDAHENRMERIVARITQPIHERLGRIEAKIDKTNSRVTHLEQHRIATDAATVARAEAVKQAADLVAEKAHEALDARTRSRGWWATRVSLAIAAVSVAVPLMGSLLHYINPG